MVKAELMKCNEQERLGCKLEKERKVFNLKINIGTFSTLEEMEKIMNFTKLNPPDVKKFLKLSCKIESAKLKYS